jgi:hypothetical protein
MSKSRALNVLILIVLCACSQKLPELQGIDLTAWSSDKNACGQKRTSMLEAMDKEKGKLLALNEMEIINLLGKPDQNELYKRNQKFYYYYLTPAQQCGEPGPVSKRLIIRFNAMGLAKEVSIE